MDYVAFVVMALSVCAVEPDEDDEESKLSILLQGVSGSDAEIVLPRSSAYKLLASECVNGTVHSDPCELLFKGRVVEARFQNEEGTLGTAMQFVVRDDNLHFMLVKGLEDLGC